MTQKLTSMQSSPWIRLVLKEPITKEGFKRFGDQCRWFWEEDIKGGQDQLTEVIMVTRSEKTSIHWFDDPSIQAQYLIIDGEVEESQKVEEQIRTHYPIFTLKDLQKIRDEAESTQDWIFCMFQAAVTAPPLYDKDFFELIQMGLSHANPSVRERTVFAVSYVGWPAFLDNLRYLAAEDPDFEVRESAQVMVEGYSRFGINSDNPIQPFSTEVGERNDYVPRSEKGLTQSYSLKYPQKTLLLKPIISVEQVTELADAQQWPLAATQEASPIDEIPFEIAWVTSNCRTAIHLLDERELLDEWQVPYYLDTLRLVIEGKELDVIEEIVQTHLQVYTLEEIVSSIKKSTNAHELANFLVYLGMVVPEDFDIQIAEVLNRMIVHKDSNVRFAAVWAAGSTGWSIFQEKLETIVKTDSSSKVSEIASMLLPGFEGNIESSLLKVLG